MITRRSWPWLLPGRRGLAAVAVAMLTALAALGLAQPSSAAQGTGPCPRSNALRQFRAADNVGATYAVSGRTTTYTFYSFTNEHPTNGVPGLVDYCVYPPTRPMTASPEARGANGQRWLSAIGSNNFAFQRPDGNLSNIPLNGQVTQMGTATWRTSAPRTQTILLHINDPAVCARIYGDDPGTCFVKPSNNPQQPICNRGASDMAYNAMPYGVTDCYTAALGFEAQSVNEFGDEVALEGTGRRLDTLQVMFASYACQSGSWTSRCTSAAGATFNHPITANVYAPDDLTHPVATVTQTVTFPYRPSSDPARCQNPSQWYNPAGNRCQNSIGTVVTFQFDGQELPDQVVWTVAFNTSHSGYHPIGTAACSTEPGGCPYDSLNVGATSFPNAPYAGADVDSDIAYLSTPPITGTLGPDSGFADFRPLGAITTTT